MGHQFRGRRVENHRKPVIGNVPHQLLPANDVDVLRQLGFDIGALKIVGDRAQARANPARGKFSECNQGVAQMTDVSWPDFVGAEKTQPPDDALRPDNLRDLRLHAEPVLHDKHHAIVFHDRRQQFGEQVVLGGFQAHTNDIAFGHVAHIPVGIHPWQREITVGRFANQAVLPHIFIVAVQQEMQLATSALQSRAIKPAKRPCADNRIASLHDLQPSKIQFVLLCLRRLVLEEMSVPHPKILRVRALFTHGVCVAVCVGIDGGRGKS